MSELFVPINITFGSNRFLNTNGVISVRGKELFKIKIGNDGSALINVEIRDRNNVLIGKVWKSSKFVHVHQDYEVTYERENGTLKRLALRRKSDNADIFEFTINAPNDIEINGIFYVEELNFPIIATRQYLDLNTNRFSHCSVSKRNTGIILDNEFVAI